MLAILQLRSRVYDAGPREVGFENYLDVQTRMVLVII